MSCLVMQHSSSHLRASYGLTPRRIISRLAALFFGTSRIGTNLLTSRSRRRWAKASRPPLLISFIELGEVVVVADAMFADLEHPVARILFLDIDGGFVVGGGPEIDFDWALNDWQPFGFDTVLRCGGQALEGVSGLSIADEHDFIEEDVDAADKGVVKAPSTCSVEFGMNPASP